MPPADDPFLQMARKRKSSEAGSEAPNQSPRRPKSEDYSQAIRKLNYEAGIDIPLKTEESLGVAGHSKAFKMSHLYNILWFNNQPALDQAVATFIRDLPTLQTSEDKYDRLIKDLIGIAERSDLTPHSSRFVASVQKDQQEHPPEAPPSPTTLTRRYQRNLVQVQHSRDYDLSRSMFSANTSFAATVDDSPRSTAPDRPIETAQTSFSDGGEVDKPDSFNSRIYPSFASRLETAMLRDGSKEPRVIWQEKIVTERPKRYRSLPFPDINQPLPASYTDDYVTEHPSEASNINISTRNDQSDINTLNTSPKPNNLGQSSTHADLFKAIQPPASKPSPVLLPPTLPAAFSQMPYVVQFEAQRLLQADIISTENLLEKLKPPTLSSLYDTASKLRHSSQKFSKLEASTIDRRKQLTFRAKLDWTTFVNGPMFRLNLELPRDEITSSLERRFGCDRFLNVDLPDFRKPPTNCSGKDVMKYFRHFIDKPQTFLGRTWNIFVLQTSKSRKSASLDQRDVAVNRLVLYASTPHASIVDVLQWSLPFRGNEKTLARKAYSRLELQMSRTVKACEFKACEIDYAVKDQTATDDKDDLRYVDPSLLHTFFEPTVSDGREMSDGCNIMSLRVASQYAQAVGLNKAPSALQARIAGSKGVWFIERRDYEDSEIGKSKMHIRLAKSQIKVERDNLDGVDRECLALNVVQHNPPARSSILHIGFLPILVNRGVPKEVIRRVVCEQVSSWAQWFIKALEEPGPRPFRDWLSSNSRVFESMRRDNGIETLAGFPISVEEKVALLLEHFFDPKECKYLAAEIEILAKQQFSLERKTFKINLSRSTTLMGIADPLGCLEPGEVHVAFENPFRDYVSGLSCSALRGMNGLVARNPAMAPWDIQKVRFVFKPELGYLTDLVVFPSKGMRPFAGKLQGGDYDGDTFWLCWEPDLVRPFQNAPAPWTVPAHADLGIIKDVTLLSDYISDPGSDQDWRHWLSEMALARLKETNLGSVTNFHERLIYSEGDIDSKEAINLVHLHDNLVDADKQGYEFDEAAWKKYKETAKLPQTLPNPAYKRFTGSKDNINDISQPSVDGNIIDEVSFKVIWPVLEWSLERVKEILSKAKIDDPDLARFYDETLHSSEPGSVERSELEGLKDALKGLRKFWGSYERSQLDWNEFVQQTRARYDAIQPKKPSHPVIVQWLRRQGGDLTIWDRLKASALAKFQYGTTTPGSLIFSVAGEELCILKANERGPTRRLALEMYLSLKLRKSRRPMLPAADVYDSDEYGGDDDLFQDF